MSLTKELVKDIDTSLIEYPLLKFFPSASPPYIEGNWEVSFSGVLLETYGIKIVFPKDYPTSIPLVFELTNKIPRKADRHLNSPDWNACLFVADARWEIWPIGASFIDFLKVPVHNFFLWQAYFDEYKEAPAHLGERSHRDEGVVEYYYEKLDVVDPVVVLRLLLGTKSIIGKNEPCPCSSKKSFKDCHLTIVKTLKTKADSKHIDKAIGIFSKILDDIRLKQKERHEEGLRKLFSTPPQTLK